MSTLSVGNRAALSPHGHAATQPAVVTLVRADRVVFDWLGTPPSPLPTEGQQVAGLVQAGSGYPFTFVGEVYRTSALAGAALTLTSVAITGRANRRLDPRVPAALQITWSGSGAASNSSGSGWTTDLSAGGCRVRVTSGSAPETDQNYRVELQLPAGKLTLGSRCRGAVGELHRFEFTAIAAKASTAIQQFVAKRTAVPQPR
jgi:PilZ domain